MSIARPSQFILCLCRRSTRSTIPRSRRALHSTPVRAAADDPEDVETINIPNEGRKSRLTPNEKWKQRYDERQVEAIQAAKEVIGDKFQKGRNVPRTDPWSVDYYDSFEKIDPVVDQPVRAPWTNLDDAQRLRTSDEGDADFQKFLESRPAEEDANGEPIAMQYVKYLESMRLTSGRKEAELDAPSAMMPSIPSPPKPVAKVQPNRRVQDEDDDDKPNAKPDSASTPETLRLMQMTGLSGRELAALRVKTIVVRRVANQTRLGKIYKQYFLSIAGNQNGMLGVGEGKADEGSAARFQSQARAIRAMQPIKRYEKRTIFGTVSGKVSATELELYARPPGFGLRCQRLIWEMANCAGIYDLAARVTRARNPMNTVKATYQALLAQKDPEDIARARGKKLVDVRKVYYAGNLT
ncbi:uncharacterized protein HMPREF1541_09949 [Cyphellophora europaea CBS 101466]|uniref:Small ribosomal subunit protein uS5m n=1 Tax=Cyphellophora europaea (strain CBS 101466) TaxID=1220924 RepID=W2SAM2_CYPE1|nr:uncharacterized protein HMPREF1541_09949 [Cyphellophora europaea CBS 101466]ETN45073.1 hypothetical protein HMPREF1541_09949 [Cyphellophora europaea CBS 101466]